MSSGGIKQENKKRKKEKKKKKLRKVKKGKRALFGTKTAVGEFGEERRERERERERKREKWIFRFSLRFTEIEPSVFIGARKKVNPSITSYAWVPKSYSFVKLHKVGNFPTWNISYAPKCISYAR